MSQKPQNEWGQATFDSMGRENKLTTGMTQVVAQLAKTVVMCYLSRDAAVGVFDQFRNCRSLNHPFLYKFCACKSVTNIILIVRA
mgnify:CR=1 FL=1